jgi:hypothetical protein
VPVNTTTAKPLSQLQINYIKKLQKRALVHRIYNNNPPIEVEATGKFVPHIFVQPVYVTHPSNYVELTNFREICENILPSVRYKKTDGKVQLGLVLKEFSVEYNNVLVCVDGIPCLDLNWVDSLSSRDIKRVEVYNSVLLHGDLTFNGVIGIYTKNNSFDPRVLCKNHYYFYNNFYPRSPAPGKQPEPIVLPNVYWNPKPNATNNPEKAIQINRPEIGTHYRLTIKGLLNNQQWYTITKTIKFK